MKCMIWFDFSLFRYTNDYQELSVAFMDAKNGFLTTFYIEIVFDFFSTFFSPKKIILKMKNIGALF